MRRAVILTAFSPFAQSKGKAARRTILHAEGGPTLRDHLRRAELARPDPDRLQSVFFHLTGRASRRLVGAFVASNSTWKDGVLDARLRQPFDLLGETATRAREEAATTDPISAERTAWRAFMDAYGTMSNPPDPNMASVFNDFKYLGLAA